MFNSPAHGNGRTGLEAAGGRFAPAQPSSSTDQAMQMATNVAKNAAETVGKCIADHPGVSLAAAVTCGVIVGWLIKRS